MFCLQSSSAWGHPCCWAPLKHRLPSDTFAVLPIPILTTNRQYYMSSWGIGAWCGCVRLCVCSSALLDHAGVILLGCQIHSYFHFSCFYLVNTCSVSGRRPIWAKSAVSEGGCCVQPGIDILWAEPVTPCSCWWSHYTIVGFLSDRSSFHTTKAKPFGSSRRESAGRTLSQTNEIHWCALRKIKQYKCFFSISQINHFWCFSLVYAGLGAVNVCLCVPVWHVRLLLFSCCLPCLDLTGSGGFLGGNMWCDPARPSPVWMLHKSC